MFLNISYQRASSAQPTVLFHEKRSTELLRFRDAEKSNPHRPSADLARDQKRDFYRPN